MNATTIEIPRDIWPAYFRDLADQYQGWSTTVELLDPTLGDQPAAVGLPLQGISYETAGSQAGDILIEVGDKGTPFETHLIHRPRSVRATSTQPGVETDIEIEAEEGPITLITLRRRPALPETGKT
jgi:hypothetical protein